jgi:hypothetical protein
VLGMGGLYFSKKWQVEKDRWTNWERRTNIENLPGHHFANRGGVLIKKSFVGFEKYHRNIDDMMGWYKKAYPVVAKE